MSKADIGVYGLGVMGSGLAQNLERNGYRVAVYNHSLPGEENDVVSDFMSNRPDTAKFVPFRAEKEFVGALDSPRKILLMVKAGNPVDQVIERLSPLMDKDDIIIDGGNSHFEDTGRRFRHLKEMGIHYLGIGISGGEEGALNGPSIMAGGSMEGWNTVHPMLNSIAAHDSDGNPCCGWMGPEGAGHFVKMIHNGIEYADMQLIAEIYHVLIALLEMDNDQIADIFEAWNKNRLGSYLLEITVDILRFRDKDGLPLLNSILDAAEQKGTGRWTAITAQQEAVPLPIITSAVQARVFSSMKNLRVRLSSLLERPKQLSMEMDSQTIIKQCEQALLASRLMALAEGLHLIAHTASERDWGTDLAEVASVWQDGCIIRSKLLEPLRQGLTGQGDLEQLLSSDFFKSTLANTQEDLRTIVGYAIQSGIPCPALSSALWSYDSLGTDRLPAHLIQAQRDYFGAHRYERVDRPRDERFHTEWQKPKRGDD